MQKSLKILSDIIVYSKYARFIKEYNRREDWDEIVDRTASMHKKRYPELAEEIEDIFKEVRNRRVLPSMRFLQFSGRAIELNESRGYNCSAIAIDSTVAFNEIIFLLLSGCGVGVSVQQHHVEKLPPLLGPSKKTKRYVIQDSIVGWADAVKALVDSYFYHKPYPRFVFDDIRPRGELLKTSGGRAPGPQPLKDAIHNVQKILDLALAERGSGTKIKTIEAHDIACHLADCVLAGGIRRAAIISLFSLDDEDMLSSKTGNWWESNPQRGRANNSVVLLRHKLKYKTFRKLWERIRASGCGEPGFILVNDKNTLTNPCGEIALDSCQFCNLTTVDVSNIESQEDLNNRVKSATILGTLQAGYTDFNYLRSIWKENSEKDALLGVSMTGIGSGEILNYDLEEAANVAKETNRIWAEKIGIKPAARIGCIKPEGTSSSVLGSSSGIHAWHSPYYTRRIRFGKDEPIYNYLKHAIPHLIEDDYFKPNEQSVVSIPIEAPKNAIFRGESAISLLERVKLFHDKWIKPSHTKGDSTHNVSCTVNIKDDEWDTVCEWMWENRDSYNGLSVLPYDNGTYIQAPFEEITEEKYNELVQYVRNIDLTKVKEFEDNTSLKEQSACSGGSCTITHL